jgi:hypothetical protein
VEVVAVDSRLEVELNSGKKVELKIKVEKSEVEFKDNDDVDVLELIVKVESIELLDRKLAKEKEDVILKVEVDEVLKLGFRSDLTDDVGNRVELNEELRVERGKDEE